MKKNKGFVFPNEETDGMTLLDYFAAAALTGLLANKNADGDDFDFAHAAYSLADCMMDWRKDI